MRMIAGSASGLARRSDVDLWMAAKGAAGAAAVLDFASGRYGFRSPAGVPRWGSVAADMVFTRASAAGRWPSAGSYEMVGSGVPRYDHDPATRVPLGVRIEGAATNLLTYSEFQNGLAGAQSVSGAVTAIADFEGGRTGLRFDNTSGLALAYKSNTTFASGAARSFAADVEIEDGLPPVFTNPTPSSNVNTFALAVAGNGVLPTRFFQIGPKAWRVIWSGTIANNNNFYGVVQYATSQQRRIKVTGYQLEAGAAASSYIVTGASAGVRAAERLYLDLTFDPAAQGITVLWDGLLPASNASVPYGLNIHPAAAFSPNFGVYSETTNFRVIANGGWGQLISNPFVANARRRCVFRISPTTLSASFDGGAVTSNALVTAIPAGMTRMDIGSAAGYNFWGSTIKQIAVWQGTLSNAQMMGLSAL